MKNRGAWFASFLTSIVFASSLVSAANAGDAFKPIVDMVSGLIGSTFNALRPLLSALVGDITADAGGTISEIFIAKILLVILIFSIVYAVLNKQGFLSEKKGIAGIVSILVALLGVRFLNADWVQMVLVPYSTFGVVVSAGIPFVVYFFLVKEFKSSTLRRLAWISFAVVFIGLYFMRASELKNTVYIYPIVALLAALMAWFDGTINRLGKKIKAEQDISNADKNIYYGLLKQRDTLEEQYLQATKSGAGQREMDRLRKQIDKINEDIKNKYPDM